METLKKIVNTMFNDIKRSKKTKSSAANQYSENSKIIPEN